MCESSQIGRRYRAKSICPRLFSPLPRDAYGQEYEPLKWRVIDPDRGLVICETIVDSQPYSNTVYEENEEFYSDSACTVYSNNYAESSDSIIFNVLKANSSIL